MRLSLRTALPLAGLALIAATGVASAKIIKLHAALAPEMHVMAKGTGEMTGTYNTVTHILTYKVTDSGMSGPVIAAHIHGPAKPGGDYMLSAPILVPLHISKTGVIAGHAKLTLKKAKIIEMGDSYVNLHTKANPKGELAGQVSEVK